MKDRPVLAIILVALSIISGCSSGIAKKRSGHDMTLTKEDIVQIATRYWLGRGGSLKYHHPVYEEGNVEWIEKLEDLRLRYPEFATQYDVLNGRDYQVVKFQLAPGNLGGSVWVFVDRCTGEVIKSYGEK